MKTYLCSLFEKYGSDKCPSINHSYSPVYNALLSPYRYKFKTILEIGIGTKQIMEPIIGSKYIAGASLRAWADFFPNAKVFGCDIDNSVLFEENRIKCYYTDQSKKESLLTTMRQIAEEELDLIIDDGSHIPDHMILSFNTLNEFLSDKGIYIIEDIKLNDINRFIRCVDNSKDFVVDTVHYGNNNWDSFVAYKRKKT